MTEPLDRRSLVEPDLSPERVEENWSAIADQLEAKRTPMRSRAWLAVAAAVLLGVVAWSQLPSAEPHWAGTTLASEQTSVHARLEDGSTIAAAPHSLLHREDAPVGSDETRIRIEEGAATFDVTRNPSRTFVVLANGVEVRVIGTRFTVTRGASVSVSVERGAVDVRRGEQVQRVRAGERWTEEAAEEPVVEALRGLDGLQQGAPGQDGLEDPEEGEAEPVAEVARAARPTADELFERAREARRTGSASEAEALYERLLRRHPRDTRVPLTAFELGRVRMDDLGDLRGAVRAFRRSLRSGASPFREDAMARIVRALARLGDTAGCQESHASYVSAYPQGRHTSALANLCD